jgi:serine protease Do
MKKLLPSEKNNPLSSALSSEATLSQSRTKARSRKDVRVIGLTIMLLIIVTLGIVAYIFLRNKNSEVLQSSRNSASELLKQQSAMVELRTIASSLGMSLTYDKKTIEAKGQTTDASSTSGFVSGVDYNGDELDTVRDYSILKFKSTEDPNSSASQFSVSAPELSVITNIRKAYWDNKTNLPEYAGKTKLDILTEENIKKLAIGNTKASTPTAVTINDTLYNKVDYATISGEGNFAYTNTDTAYYTVQNDRPYTITIYGSSKDQGQVRQLEAIIATLKYSVPDSTKLASTDSDQSVHLNVGTSFVNQSNYSVTSAAAVSLPEKDANVPSALDSDTIVDVVLRNQPSVVRIGAARCADVELKDVSSGITKILSDSCSGGIGSGSFVTADGYIATNGHVVSISDSSLIFGYVALAKEADQSAHFKELLDFAQSIKVLTSDTRALLLDGIRDGSIDPGAYLNKLAEHLTEYATLKNDQFEYIIQTSNDPLRADNSNGKFHFNYSNTNIKATFVAKNYDDTLPEGGLQLNTLTSTDVAILKADGTFPVIKTASFSDVKEGDQLTALGYPAFVDDGLNTKSTKTVPSVTQGRISRINNDPTNTYKLATTTVPIASGNSGGPAFNNAGQQIGLNTYSTTHNCSDDKCFGKGFVRDMKDLSNLANKNSVNLTGESAVNKQWNKALDAYLVGDFKGAEKEFKKANEQYPANYLAASFITLSASKIGTADDRSSQFGLSPILMYVLIGVAVLIVVLIIVALMIIRKHHKQHGTRKKPIINEPAVSAQGAEGVVLIPETSNNPTMVAYQQQSDTVSQPISPIPQITPPDQASTAQVVSAQPSEYVVAYPQTSPVVYEAAQAPQIQHLPESTVQPTVQVTNIPQPIEQQGVFIPTTPTYQQVEASTIKTTQIAINQQKVFAQPMPNNIEFVQPNTAPGIITGGPQGQAMDILPQSQANRQ